MQIFATFQDPELCAKVLDDKRVCKMIVESAQIMSTVMHLYNDSKAPYKKTHEHHPCVKWTFASPNNFGWLFKHFQFLIYQYDLRYQKTHSCWRLIKIFDTFLIKQYSIIHGSRLMPFPNATIFKKDTVHNAYKRHLIRKWRTDKRQPKWNKASLKQMGLTSGTMLFDRFEDLHALSKGA